MYWTQQKDEKESQWSHHMLFSFICVVCIVVLCGWFSFAQVKCFLLKHARPPAPPVFIMMKCYRQQCQLSPDQISNKWAYIQTFLSFHFSNYIIHPHLYKKYDLWKYKPTICYWVVQCVLMSQTIVNKKRKWMSDILVKRLYKKR